MPNIPTPDVVAADGTSPLPTTRRPPTPDFDVIDVNHGDTSIKVAPLGAQVLSFMHKGKEYFYVCDQADVSGATPFRGGMPVVGLTFGDGSIKEKLGGEKNPEMPLHGFLRNLVWNVQPQTYTEDGNGTVITFKASSEDVRNPAWLNGESFEAEISYTIKEGSLQTSFKLTNKGEKPIDVQFALHTYFDGDPQTTKIRGLGDRYIDAYDKTAIKEGRYCTAAADEKEQGVTPLAMTRIYENSPDEVTIKFTDDSGRGEIKITQTEMPDAIAWNPSMDQPLKDIDESERLSFFCLERANICRLNTIGKDGTFSCSQTISIE